jgi:polysaccharide pyruvyl transferase WcaK-like protein
LRTASLKLIRISIREQNYYLLEERTGFAIVWLPKLKMVASEKKFACVIWGGYAWGNTGDELCLAAALERKQREFAGDVAILTRDPKFTSQLFPEANVIQYVMPDPRASRLRKRFSRNLKSLFTKAGRNYFLQYWRFDPGIEWMRCLFHARELYLCGGGYLTDLFPLEFALPPVRFAAKIKLPITTAPVGLGPFKSEVWSGKVVKALRQTKLTVRDKISLEFCRRHGLDASLQPDDAFALVKKLSAAIPEARSTPCPRKIGVCIFTQYGQDANCDFSDWWVKCLRGLKTQYPEFEIEGFCFHTSPQAEFQEMTRLFSRAGLSSENVLPPTTDFRQAVKRLCDYDLIIATRFHAVVAANVFEIPNIAIAAGEYYQTKMSAAVDGCEKFSRLVNPASESPEGLLDICRQKLSVFLD